MEFESQNRSLRSRTFLALITTQFLGAFNDNLFKTVVSLLVLNEFVGKSGGIVYLSLTAALFFLPYILFSAYAGFLSDRFPKSSIVRWTKILEGFVMVLGVLSFAADAPLGLLACVFFMGMQSALFSPSKYGILPEMLKIRELPKANGYLELSTFSAIIFGTAGAGFLTSDFFSNPGYIPLLLAFVGIGASFLVEPLEARAPHARLSLDPIGPNISNLRAIHTNRALFLSVLGIAFFWSFGALFQLNILLFAKQALDIDDIWKSLLLASLGLGIGIGSVVAGKVSEGKVELGLVPIGSVGIVVFDAALSFCSGSFLFSSISVFLIGLSSGFFIVPLQTYLQEFSPPKKRGAFIAASNFLSFCAMLGVSFLFWFFTGLLGIGSADLFLIKAIAAFAVCVYLFKLLPETLVRCVNWIALHTIYDLKKESTEEVPESGGALLVCNHVTYVDAMILLASLFQPVRFIMWRPIYDHWLINPIARLMGAIPIDSRDGRESIERTLRESAVRINEGELVGIFAEGGLTKTGEIAEFKSGLETIMQHTDAPIIPVHLGGLWGSLFSRKGKKSLIEVLRSLPYPVTISFGQPLPARSSAKEVEEAVRALGTTPAEEASTGGFQR